MQQIARKAVEGILAEAAALADDVPQRIEDVTRARRALSKGLCWDAPANRSMLCHLALAQPWSIEQAPIRNWIEDGTAEATLAALLGVTFDETNLQPYRTARLCTRWARDAAQLVHACDTARERHHPVPQRQMGMVPLAGEEGQRPAVAAALLSAAGFTRHAKADLAVQTGRTNGSVIVSRWIDPRVLQQVNLLNYIPAASVVDTRAEARRWQP
jgi:hypothetical protein